MKKRSLVFFLMVLFIYSCEDEIIYVQSGPSIEIIQPINNSTVSDTITIIASAPTNQNTVRTEIFINHDFVTSFQKPPYEYFWNVGYFPDGSQHIIEAKAYDDAGNVGVSKPVIVYCYRFMPSYLIAVLTSDTTIDLQWIDNSKFETGFEIEYKLNNSTFNKIASVDSNITFYKHTGYFDQNQNHYFRIRAKSKDSYSGYSNTALAYIQVQKPTNLNVVFNSDTTCQISWKDNTTFENLYLVQIKINNNYVNVKEVPVNSTSASVSFDFLNNVTYEFRVAAMVNNYFYYSDPLFSKYSFYAPNILSIEDISLSSLRINWNNNNNFNTRFRLERKVNDLNFIIYSEISPGQLSFIDTQVDSSNKYSYRITAYTRVNVSQPSNTISASCLPIISFDKNIQAPEYFTNFDLSTDESLIAICNETAYKSKSYLLNTSTGSILKTFTTGDSLEVVLSHIGINYNNTMLATASYGKYITFWDVISQTVKNRTYLFYYMDDLIAHPTRNVLFTSGSGNVILWDFGNARVINTITSPYRYYSLTISHDGNKLAIGGSLDKTKIIDIESGTVIKTLSSYGDQAKILFSMDDNSLIVVTPNKISIVNIYSGDTKEYSINNYGNIYYSALHPNGNHLILTTVASNNQRWFVIFNMAKAIIENAITRSYGSKGIRFFADGEYLLSMGDFHFLTKWKFYLAKWQVVSI